MAQAPRRLSPHRSAKDLFGAELRHWRDHRGLSQIGLGELVYASGAFISKVEKAERWPSAHLAEACDAALDTGGVLTRIWPLVDEQQARERHPGSGTAAWPLIHLPSDTTAEDLYGFATVTRAAWPDTTISGLVHGTTADGQLVLAGGKSLNGAVAGFQVHPVSPDRSGRLAIQIADPDRFDRFARVPGRGVLVGAEPAGESVRFYALDAAGAHARARRSSTHTVVVPRAYELDELTYALMWAAANLDDALLADDAVLADSRRDIGPYHRLAASAVSRDIGPELGAVSQMWLGSAFCAGHIQRHLRGLDDVPAFWTGEQRGEEACSWLLFRHKYAYLHRTGQHFAGARMVRAFCVPEDAVTDSPTFERIVFLLAAALMEALDIEVQVCVEPDYSAVEGFVLTPRRAIIANWVRSDGIWHVDMTSRGRVVAEFTDAAGHARAHSAIQSGTPAGRIAALADYLGLDWAWLRRRCAAVGRAGCADLIRPRSRLLSVTGLDVACRYVGSLGAMERAG